MLILRQCSHAAFPLTQRLGKAGAIKSFSQTFLSRLSIPLTYTYPQNLDKRLLERKARETGICPVREELYTQCLDELIRQVSGDEHVHIHT